MLVSGRVSKNYKVEMLSNTLVNQHGWLENGPGLKMYFPKNGDIPASYVSLPEGMWKSQKKH